MCLLAADQDGYRQACREMLRRFGSSPDPVVIRTVSWACSLGTLQADDQRRSLVMAEFAVGRSSPKTRYGDLLVVGANLLRPGRFRDALAKLDEAVASNQAREGTRVALMSAMAYSGRAGTAIPGTGLAADRDRQYQ